MCHRTGPRRPLQPSSATVSNSDLAAFLAQQRWFAGKSRAWEVTNAVDLGWLRREAPAVRILLVTVTYDDGDTETYQVPLVHHARLVDTLMHVFVGEGTDENGERVFVFDALHDKEATELWWRGIAESTARQRMGIPPQRDRDRAARGRAVARRRRGAEQHLADLRRHGDPQGLPQGLPRAQPRHRDPCRARCGRQQAHRATARLARGPLAGSIGRDRDREPGDGAGLPARRHRGLGARQGQRARPLWRGRPARRRGRR